MNKVVIVPGGFSIMDGKIISMNGYGSCELTNTNLQTVSLPTTYDSHTGMPRPNVATFQPNKPQGSFIYDPMNDITSWYGVYPTIYHEVDTSTINIKFWRQADINDWLEENVEEHVFVQRSGYDRWRLAFVSYNDANKFYSWYGNKTKEQLVIVDANVPATSHAMELKVKEIKAWCQENLKGKSDVRVSATVIHAYIKDEVEAVAFKLRWTGHQEVVDI